MRDIIWRWKSFSDLTRDELYEVLALRDAVFNVEQHCSCLDVDGMDQVAIHLLGMTKGTLVAYARFFPPDACYPGAVSFGRVAVAADFRGRGLGKALMHEVMKYYQQHYSATPIEISAQDYLKEFYTSLGFEAYGEGYDEGGIAHTKMRFRVYTPDSN